MEQSLVSRHPAADREDYQRDDQRPEVKLFAVTERVIFVRGSFALMHAQKEQAAVARVHDRMNAFGNHRGAAGEGRGGKLGCGNGNVGDNRRVNRLIRFGHRLTRSDRSMPGRFPRRSCGTGGAAIRLG